MSNTNTYKLLPMGSFSPVSRCILHVETGNIIPFDEDNRHYQEYLAWLAEGNEPLPPDPVEGA